MLRVRTRAAHAHYASSHVTAYFKFMRFKAFCSYFTPLRGCLQLQPTEWGQPVTTFTTANPTVVRVRGTAVRKGRPSMSCAYAGLTCIHPAHEDRAPDATPQEIPCACRVMRLWEACKQLTRWRPSRKDDPFRRSLADVSLNHSRREEEDNDPSSFTSINTTKQGNASAFLEALEDGVEDVTPHQVLNLAMVRFKDPLEDTPAGKT